MGSDTPKAAASNETPATNRRAEVSWLALAIVLYGATTASVFGELLRSDLTVFSPVLGTTKPEDLISFTDQRLSIWAVARNARTLMTHPSRILDAEQCFPTPKAHALGHHFLTLGVVGVPPYLATRDPVATHNLVLLLLSLLSPLAMYLLVKEWTGVPLAGLTAGLIYGFHPMRIGSPVQPDNFDTVWMVLALLFAQRLFARGRWIDALALALAGALQIGTSPYPLLGAALIALPVAIWLVAAYGVRTLRPLQIAAIFVIVAAAVALVIGPALALTQGGTVFPRKILGFLSSAAVAPGSYYFPGWTYLLLALAGAALASRATRPQLQHDPRWALLFALILIWLVATGGAPFASTSWNPYPWLARLIPGLAYIRADSYLFFTGGHVAMSLLAGLGAAALARSARGRWSHVVATMLLIVSAVDLLRPETLGLEPRIDFRLIRQRPDEMYLDFFRELERLGNDGPVFEAPVLITSLKRPMRASRQLLMSAYHHRATSECYNSYASPSRAVLESISEDLPARAALDAARELGFTTILVHGRKRGRSGLPALFDAAALDGAGLRKLHAIPGLAAYALLPETAPRAPGSSSAQGSESAPKPIDARR